MPSTDSTETSTSNETAAVGAPRPTAATVNRTHEAPRRSARRGASAEADAGVLTEGWSRIIDSRRKVTETDVLGITRPRGKLDPLAKGALRKVCELLESAAGKTKAELECALRDRITDEGIASEVKRITQRLNARRMSDGLRWVLAETYPFLLEKLLASRRGKDLERLVADDLGVAEELMLLLEARNGPVHRFSSLIVKAVMDKNKIAETDVFCERVSQQVRSVI